MKNRILLLILFLTSVFPVIALANENHVINTNFAATTPTSRFVDNGNGTITDTVTKLMWKKCPEGLDGFDCSSEQIQRFTWQEALQRAQTTNNSGGYSGYTDWRIPNIKELQSIVEYHNATPAINLDVFPNTHRFSNTVKIPFWSSTSGARGAYILDFEDGEITSDTKNVVNKFFVRLVRSGQ